MNLESIKRRLLVKYPFFGSIVASSNFIAEKSVRTAETDGQNIYYNPDFIESVTNDQQTFIFAHEICHIAFDHIYRSEGKDEKLWNIATDAVINAFLKQDKLPMVEGVIDIPEAINFDAEEMYKKLLSEKNQQSNQSQNGNSQKQEGNQSNGGSSKTSNKEEKQQDVGHDTHSMWTKAVEKKHQEDQQLQSELKQFNGKVKDKRDALDKLRKLFDKKKIIPKTVPESCEKRNKEQENKTNEEIKKLTKIGEKEAFKQNEIERKKQLEELRKALASQSHGYGNVPNSEIRNITNIGISKPLIDWRRLLKEAVKYDIDWSYQNAEIENGVVTAHLEEIPRPATEIILDTSGSIDETLLRNFLRECKNILQTSKVKVGCFDTKFYGFTEIKNVSDIDNMPFYGGGGTDFEVAVKAFTRRVENKIIFTDGDADMPSIPMDAIWIVFGETEIKPLGGKVIYIDDEQLERLYNYEMTTESKGRSR